MALGLLNRWRRDRRGVSAIEFAFIAPILILCYFGVAELCGAMLAQRKASHVASEIGDLVAQCQTVAASDFTDIWTVGAAVMTPMSTSTLGMRITSVVADSTGATTVGWSQDSGGSLTKFATNAAYTGLPAGLVSPNGSVIVSETQYTYTSPVSYVIKSPIPFNNKFYLSPRQTGVISFGTACGS